MDDTTKNENRKNTKISFRTDEDTLSKLRIICRSENKTISSLIEEILIDHVRRYINPIPLSKEKRRSYRRKCAIPVVISSQTEDQRIYYNGTIVNISLSTLQILTEHIEDNLIEKEIHALFTIPTRATPMLVPCRITKLDYAHGECIIIANFLFNDDSEKNAIDAFINTSIHASKTYPRAQLS